MSAGASIRDAAAEISFPRGAGTEGDARVRQILAERLRALGFGVREREFAFDAQRAILRIRAGLLVVAAGLVLAVMHSKIEPALVAGRILLILAGAAFIARALLWDEGLFADKGQRTANVVGRLGEAVRGRVVLVAHHDSKSQNYPFLVRGALIAVGLAGLAAGLLLLVLQLAGVAPDG
ncbi:MAG: hypothetical protein KBD01_19080, partial [Acidobacteria bacterium]|nr:hypothetical protein [Acidobacteriota bacterium]